MDYKGNSFDWGKTSKDYAKYRDIYPQEFYDKILSRGLCCNGQKILAKEQNMNIEFYTCPAEEIDYPENTFDVQVSFTRESWHGRMKACRGVGASMSPETMEAVTD